MSVRKQFAKYVSQNVLGMIGISLYILADTFFIAKAVGSKGITALNLVLPVYSLIFAIGAMIGVGSGIRFSIARSKGEEEADSYFSNALFFGTLIGIIFMFMGILIRTIRPIRGRKEKSCRMGLFYNCAINQQLQTFLGEQKCFIDEYISQ